MKKTFGLNSERIEGMSRVWAAGSRIALLLTAIIVFLMPLTEYLWHFDKFLRGGQDFEFGLLAVATILCLVMFLLQHGKQTVQLTLSLRKWLSMVFQFDAVVVPGSFSGLITAQHVISVPSPSLGLYTHPLQV
jgi:hypothetical protein